MKLQSNETLDGLDVLFIATDLSTGGGVNRVIGDLANVFTNRLGLSVRIVSARNVGKATYSPSAGVPVDYHPKQSLLGYFMLLLRLRRTRPAFVVGSWTQDNILITLAFLFSRTKVVLMEHASWHFATPLVRLLRRLVYPAAWRVVVLNPTDLAHYRKHLKNVSLLPNPLSQMMPEEDKPREKLVLAIGHLNPNKNFGDAIRAMAASGLEKEGWSLAIIGKGEAEGGLQELAAELGLQRISILAPTDDVASWYGRTSIILITSRSEVFSLVLAEAMLSGVVPLAYGTDGPSFVLADFPDLLVTVGDVDRLAEGLARVARDSDLEPLRQRLRATITERFSPEVVGEQWRRLLS